MNLVEERNSWRELFENGYIPQPIEDGYQPHISRLVEYTFGRHSESWRASRIMEQCCEYVIWKQENSYEI